MRENASITCNYRHKTTRFDEAEFSATDPASRIQRASISFQGVLEIETLDWLSPRGKELVEKDLRRRDIKKRLGNVPSGSNLTLEEVYRRDPTFRLADKSQGRKIKLRIQGQKNMPALFLAGKLWLFNFFSLDTNLHRT